MIYVGITSRDPYFREREHENATDGKMNIYKCEMCDLHFLVVVTYSNRRDCEYAETQEIQRLRSFENIKKNPDSGDVRWEKYTEWWSKNCIPCQ